MSRHDTIDEIEDKYMDRIKELIAERDCWIDTANMFKDEQQKMIESQAAEITSLQETLDVVTRVASDAENLVISQRDVIEKYKTLYDQMVNALKTLWLAAPTDVE